jgi:hypothetical protein
MAVETSELLMLDAMEDAPQLYVVLTARELLERADCRDHLSKLRRSLRRRWPDVRWACLVEFQRRGALHLNLLVKGVPADEREQLHEHVCRVWCARVDAEPQAQFVGEVSDGGGLVRYIALHFLKPAQAPPIGWRGHRWSYSRDYLVRPAAEMREQARRSLRLKRELWRALQAGHEAHDAELVAHQAVEVADATTWELVALPRERVSPLEPSRGAPVAWYVVDAALRWSDERAAIAAAWAELEGGPSSPPAPPGGAPPGRGPQLPGLARPVQ